jgi:putative tryptophan/tyrosine transport system substrate-binding protein
MRRRNFIAGITGSAVGWPLAARAQGLVPIVGFATSGSRANQDPIAGLEAGLKEMGFVQGQNVALEYRFAEGKPDRFPALISDLVQRKVAVLVVSTPQGVLAAKQATTGIPIVFSLGSDPVQVGLVPSFNKPGGNLTGVYQLTAGLESKRLALLHEMVPKVDVIGVLVNPNNYGAIDTQLHDVQEAAGRLGLQLVIVRANVESEFEPALSTITARRAGALLVCASPFFYSRRQQLVFWLPAMGCLRFLSGAISLRTGD